MRLADPAPAPLAPRHPVSPTPWVVGASWFPWLALAKSMFRDLEASWFAVDMSVTRSFGPCASLNPPGLAVFVADSGFHGSRRGRWCPRLVSKAVAASSHQSRYSFVNFGPVRPRGRNVEGERCACPRSVATEGRAAKWQIGVQMLRRSGRRRCRFDKGTEVPSAARRP